MILLLLACGAPTPTSSSSGELSLLSYNVHGLPSAITGDDTPGRMEQISPLLDAFDVAAIQEDFDPDNHALLAAQDHHDQVEVFDEKLDDSRAYGSGLAVFTDPLAAPVFTEHFTACNGLIDDASDCLASKGFQVLRLTLGGASLDLYNTHLDAGDSAGDVEARTSNVRQILDSMQTRSAGNAVIFMGDTNLDPDEDDDLPLIDALLDAGLRDACQQTGCDEPLHIDRVMVRDSQAIALQVLDWANQTAFQDADGVPLSDHPAISARVGWATSQDTP